MREVEVGRFISTQELKNRSPLSFGRALIPYFKSKSQIENVMTTIKEIFCIMKKYACIDCGTEEETEAVYFGTEIYPTPDGWISRKLADGSYNHVCKACAIKNAVIPKFQKADDGKYVVRLYDGMDNQWMDVSEP